MCLCVLPNWETSKFDLISLKFRAKSYAFTQRFEYKWKRVNALYAKRWESDIKHRVSQICMTTQITQCFLIVDEQRYIPTKNTAAQSPRFEYKWKRVNAHMRSDVKTDKCMKTRRNIGNEKCARENRLLFFKRPPRDYWMEGAFAQAHRRDSN